MTEVSESTALAVIESVESLKAVVVFAPGGVDDILNKLKSEVRAIKTDISTPTGRAQIKSLAYKVARSKTALDDLGKDLTADLKAQTNAIDAERRKLRDELDALKEEVRKPLTDRETAEEDRVKAHEEAIEEIARCASFLVMQPGSHEIKGRIAHLQLLQPRDWQEFAQRAQEVTATALASLTALLAVAEKREADEAELVRLREEEAERLRQEQARLTAEREAKIAADAAEAARIEAEAKAAKEAEEAAARQAEELARVESERRAAEERAIEEARIAAEKAEADRLTIQQAKDEADARAAKAEADRIASEKAAKEAAEQAERDRVAAAERAEADRLAAAQQAEQDRQAAINAERQRAEKQRQDEEAETARRAADKAHRQKFNGEALAGLVTAGLTEEQGKSVIIAVATGLVPHVTMNY